MRRGRLVAVILAGVVAAVVVVTAYYIHSLRKQAPTLLVACMRVERAPVAWACKQALIKRSIAKEEVDFLNQEAGIVGVLGFEEPADASLVIEKFLNSGVDINAVHQALGNTALHTLVSSRDIQDIQLMLRYGARTDIRDRAGRTPLEYATELQKKNPDEGYESVVSALRQHENETGSKKRLH
jgi:ankyrin repeat protein